MRFQAEQDRRSGGGFTLPELLVVVGIIALLLGIVLPIIRVARQAARRTVCLSNERQIGAAIFAYAADYDGAIPYGPVAPAATSSNFYPGTGDVTSLLSLQNGSPVALGLLTKAYLSSSAHVLFCPGTDQIEDADAELSKMGRTQAQGDYYYRHGSNVSLSDVAIAPNARHIRLADLGSNRNGKPIRALAMDQQYWVHSSDPTSPFVKSMAQFGVVTRTNHERRFLDVLFADGHAASLDNFDGRYTVDITGAPEGSLDLILKVFEAADEQ